MTVRRVFVIWTHPLFHESVRLLLKHPEIIWVGAARDITTAYEQIMGLQPDTILFEKTGAAIPPGMMELLEMDIWNVRMIGLSLDDNEMSLYQREHHTVGEAGDLLYFVLG